MDSKDLKKLLEEALKPYKHETEEGKFHRPFIVHEPTGYDKTESKVPIVIKIPVKYLITFYKNFRVRHYDSMMYFPEVDEDYFKVALVPGKLRKFIQRLNKVTEERRSK